LFPKKTYFPLDKPTTRSSGMYMITTDFQLIKYVIFYFYLFATTQFDLPITQKKTKLWRLLKIEDFILKCRVPPPLAHLYRWKEDNICQGLWEQSELLSRTCWETHWELGQYSENLMGTHWELNQGKMKKKSFSSPAHSHGCDEYRYNGHG
jgi:hypothetical protein